MRVEIGDVALDLTSEQVESLREQLAVDPVDDKMISAAEAARRLGVDRDWVYAHADELGAERLGDGPRPRLRFDPAKLLRDLEPQGSSAGGRTPLLAIRGRGDYPARKKSGPRRRVNANRGP